MRDSLLNVIVEVHADKATLNQRRSDLLAERATRQARKFPYGKCLSDAALDRSIARLDAALRGEVK